MPRAVSYVGRRQAKPHFTCIWKETLWQYSRSRVINGTDVSFVIKPPQNNKQYLNEGRSLVTMAVSKLSEKKGKEKKPSSSSTSVQHLLDAHPPVGTPIATFDEDKRKTWQSRSEQDDWVFKCQGAEASQRCQVAALPGLEWRTGSEHPKPLSNLSLTQTPQDLTLTSTLGCVISVSSLTSCSPKVDALPTCPHISLLAPKRPPPWHSVPSQQGSESYSVLFLSN